MGRERRERRERRETCEEWRRLQAVYAPAGCVLRGALRRRDTMLNRGAVLIRPGPGFIEWARALDDSDIVPSAGDEQTVYLVPEWDDEIQALEILAEGYEEIFERELFGWHTDESAWPKNRTFAMFRQWFEFEFHSVVEDLCGYALLDDEPE